MRLDDRRPAVVEALVRLTVQLPVVPTVVHVLALSVPGPVTIEKLIVVPAGAFTKPPVPALTLTCAVNVCGVADGFVAVAGVIWMFASTNVFTASTELPFDAVGRDRERQAADESVAVACPVTLPAVGEMKVIVH